MSADVVAAVVVAWFGLEGLGSEGPAFAGALLVGFVPLINAGLGLYDRDERLINRSTLEEASTLFQGATLASLTVFLVESALLQRPMGALVVGTTWLGLTIAVPACRTASRVLARRLLPPERCLVVGDHVHGRRVAVKLGTGPGIKVEVTGVVPIGGDGPPSGERQLATLHRLASVIEREGVHRVVVAAGAESPEQELEHIQAAKALGVHVSVLPRVLDVVGSSATYDYVDGLTLLGVPHFGLARRALIAKRGFDLAASAVLLIVTAPLLAIIALAVRATSPGPILFRQTRIGREGRPFSMLKFRSMCDGADRMKAGLRHRNEAQGLFKIADDPRVTRVGRMLRRTSLDELPQLFNVLLGEMSVVGPRPLVPDEDSQIQGWHRERLRLTPGMTGPWQVLGSVRIPLHEMVTIDYLYVANWSLWGDIKIMLRTLLAMAQQRGA